MGHQPIFRAINFNRDKRTGFCKPVSGAKRRPVGQAATETRFYIKRLTMGNIGHRISCTSGLASAHRLETVGHLSAASGSSGQEV